MAFTVRSTMGSSPRVRGKPADGGSEGVEVRLIPARAGKTPSPHSASPGTRAHPRACGENEKTMIATEPALGSSPRVRGKLQLPGANPLPSRLIPARAGKTCRALSTASRPGAHPRACGENSSSSRARRRWWGSSPRVRGKLAARVDGEQVGRLIPARAGKTPRHYSTHIPSGAHPRASGENWAITLWTGQRSGLIPARAGKTFLWTSDESLAEAHPRACGENSRDTSDSDP